MKEVLEAARRLHASGDITDSALAEFDRVCQNSSQQISEHVTDSGCCIFHSIGLCTEDIILNMAKKGRVITAVKLLKEHGFTLKEGKDLVEKIISKRIKPV